MRNPSILRGDSGKITNREEEHTTAGDFLGHRPPTARKNGAGAECISDRIVRVSRDLNDLNAFHKVRSSPQRYERIHGFFQTELDALEEVPFEIYDQNGKIDYLLLKNWLRYQLIQLQYHAEKDQRVLSLLGGYFPIRLAHIIDARQRVDDADGKQTASRIVEVLQHIDMVKSRIINGKEPVEHDIALHAANTLEELKEHMQEWWSFYKDYDPQFTYWVSDPYPKLDVALQDLRNTIKRVVLGIEPTDEEAIIGEPIGRAGISAALEVEMIPYTPEELIEVGRKEYRWCEDEMRKAASELGFQEWRNALEYVKQQYVEPGQQPRLVRDLMKEATTYVKKHELVTVPPICEDTIQMFMMSPADQKVNPFFLGGDSIIVSYPTSTMSHDQKLMGMRGNNIHFSRATVFHEMIPGHHLHMHYLSRHRAYRQLFSTPFSIEGWAYYWEMLLWDAVSWPKTPENRIGMLFWRMHRCARIVFSLKYHLGEMSVGECIKLLVDWVGHEQATAEGEVRRSVMGGYGPLYQAAYMLGGLQLYALRQEVLRSGRLKEKDFHERFLRANQMPNELFRALVRDEELDRDFKSEWRFYGGQER
ncbi:hypothetical protein K458DRAFT_418990 [Lentithecium fluviatile CBS 122367]|uniref:X-Pro dipeptidyl-peptidase n=1 Tax=Lentithecium fluviatile CBS 122367 TaxID=1168545 RepID=A0A6G1IYR4_9PLEO|nr:hypothetical protein K458DRAFT_418990 [Lentithecium fluviatile CBS 122367]